jgi:uncharacterized membrane protein YagU involved in acid resistance
MTSSSQAAAGTQTSRALLAILFAGLLSGCLDITAAFITWWPRGVKPSRLLQGIAAGWLGPASFNGGTATAGLGLAFHFLIAFTAAAVFFVVSRKLTFIVRRPILAGALYGIAVYLVMYWVVMPLSNFHGTQTVTSSIIAIGTHIICVGLPISLVIHRFSRSLCELKRISTTQPVILSTRSS